MHTNGMIEMSKQLSLKVALILFLSAGPSAACDPEEMINELRAQCRDAITSAVTLIEPLKPALAAPDRNTVEKQDQGSDRTVQLGQVQRRLYGDGEARAFHRTSGGA